MIENRRRKFIGNLLNDEIFTVSLYFSVMTFSMCFKCVLILVFFRPPPQKKKRKKLTMAQLRHLEIGIDATSLQLCVVYTRSQTQDLICVGLRDIPMALVCVQAI